MTHWSAEFNWGGNPLFLYLSTDRGTEALFIVIGYVPRGGYHE